MKITYDPEKNRRNIVKHGLDFERVIECDWSQSMMMQDTRKEYSETRYIAFVYLEHRLCNVVFTYRDDAMRIISFRKVNQRERKKYEQRK